LWDVGYPSAKNKTKTKKQKGRSKIFLVLIEKFN